MSQLLIELPNHAANLTPGTEELKEKAGGIQAMERILKHILASVRMVALNYKRRRRQKLRRQCAGGASQSASLGARFKKGETKLIVVDPREASPSEQLTSGFKLDLVQT